MRKKNYCPHRPIYFFKCNYRIMHSNIFVIFTLLKNALLKKQKMRSPIDVLYNEVRSKYQGIRIMFFT